MGGVAALYEAGTYLIGFALWIGVLNYSSDLEPAQQVASFVNNQNLWYVLNLVVYIVWFIWLGILMLRKSPSTAAEKPGGFVPRHGTTT